MSRGAIGIVMMVGSCTIWGLSPLYYALLSHLPPLDVLAHRVVWSLVFFAAWLGMQGRVGTLVPLLATRSVFWVAAAALMVSVNWFTFIWAIGAQRVTDASLGYFIFPLVSVLFGAVLFGERLSMGQLVAVLLAAIAVIVLTYGLGVAPWVSLILAVTFGIYGVLKKRIAAGPVVSVTAEVIVVLPLALAVLLVSPIGFGGTLASRDLVLLIVSGPLTAVPLVLFAGAARRISLASLGLLQYLNPSLQFFVAVVLLSEPLGFWYAVCFPVIWAALALYSWSAWAQERRRATA